MAWNIKKPSSWLVAGTYHCRLERRGEKQRANERNAAVTTIRRTASSGERLLPVPRGSGQAKTARERQQAYEEIC